MEHKSVLNNGLFFEPERRRQGDDICSRYLQLMWFKNYVCSLFAKNVVSFAVNLVLSAQIFSINVVTK